MRVARYYSHDDVRVEEMPVPRIGRGEILVEAKACGLCGSDLMGWYVRQKAPTVLGHEPAGVVAEVGEGVKDFAVGDRVFVHHHVPCLVCHYCRRGHYSLCPTFKQTHLDPGGFAEYIRVPAPNVQRDTLKLPDDLSFEEATLIEPTACGIRSIQRANIQPGDTVLVIGAGQAGLLLIQLARMWGAAPVIATDFVGFRLEVARKLGADHVINPKREDVSARLYELNEGRGADVVIVTPGNVAAIEEGIELVGQGGTVHLYAPPPPESLLTLAPHRLYFSEITINASYSCSPLDTRLALELIHRGRVKAKELITHRFGLDGVGEALQLATQAGESLKILIIP